MKITHWSMLALLAGASACSSSPDTRSGGGPFDDTGGNATGDDGTGGSDGPSTGGGGGGGGGGSSSDGTGNDGNSDPTVCEEFAVNAKPTTPDMLIVLDRSGSMKRNNVNRWDPSVSAINTVTAQLESSIRFGLMMFPGAESFGGIPIPGLGGCGVGKVDVPIDIQTADEIANVLNGTTPLGGTPTGATLQEALKVFGEAAIDPDAPPAPKFVLLVSDGQPTCPDGGGNTPNDADNQLAYDATDALLEAGVKTYVIGYDTKNDANLATVLDQIAQHGGTDTHRAVEDESSLLAEFEKIAGEVVSCSFSLDEEPPDPSYVLITLDGEQVNLNDPDGWSISGKAVTLQGAACATLQDGGQHQLSVKVACEVVVPI